MENEKAFDYVDIFIKQDRNENVTDFFFQTKKESFIEALRWLAKQDLSLNEYWVECMRNEAPTIADIYVASTNGLSIKLRSIFTNHIIEY